MQSPPYFITNINATISDEIIQYYWANTTAFPKWFSILEDSIYYNFRILIFTDLHGEFPEVTAWKQPGHAEIDQQ